MPSVGRGWLQAELHQIIELPGAQNALRVKVRGERLRAPIMGTAELGELIRRAFILRRAGLLERGVGRVLLGRASCFGHRGVRRRPHRPVTAPPSCVGIPSHVYTGTHSWA
jgi:hypothetical protein